MSKILNNLTVVGNTNFSGLVGIGNPSPLYNLDISGSVNITSNILIGGNTTITGTLQHGGLTLSAGTNIDQILSITKSLTLTTDWQDVGISSTDLATGTYAIQLYANDTSAGGYNNNEYYSGIMSWYAGATSTTDSLPTDEIVLHRAGGGSVETSSMYLRTHRGFGLNNLKLQLYANLASVSAANYVFKFRRII